MKTCLGFLLLTFFATSAFATVDPKILKSALEHQNSCSNFVRFDNEYLYLGFGPYKKGFEDPRVPIPARVHVSALQGSEEFDLATNDGAIDLVSDGRMVYVLTYSGIEQWDRQTRTRVQTYEAYAHNGTLEYKEHPQAMARYKNWLVVAHGRLGVSIFDLTTHRLHNQFRLIPEQLPLESMATGIEIVGNTAYIVMDNFHLAPPEGGKAPFRGLVLLDLEREKVVSQLDGLDPGADALISDGKKMILSFMGFPIWKYDVQAFSSSKLPEPERRIWKFADGGHPTGRATMDEKYYYTCFFKSPPPGTHGNYSEVPVALDRKMYLLD